MSKFGKTISKLNRSPPGAEGKTADVLLPDYHNYTELISELEQLADSYPTTSQLYIQGSTVEGRQLAVIRISDKVQQVATSRKNNFLTLVSGQLCTCHFLVNYSFKFKCHLFFFLTKPFQTIYTNG